MKLKANQILKLVILIILIMAIIAFFPKISSLYGNVESLIELPYGVLVYMFLMMLAILIAPIPASPLAILAGIIFGPWPGMLYTLISATIGAVLAFSIARFFLKDNIGKWFENHNWFRKLEGKDNKNIVLIVFLTRLMPQVSFDAVSYAAGLTSVNIFAFALATFLGMIPIVFLLSFFGYLIKPYTLWFLTALFLVFIVYIIHIIVKNKN